MKILITGGSGFLGSALARSFRTGGHDVSLLLRPTSSLKRLQGPLQFEIKRADSLAQAQDFVSTAKPDALIHTACSYGRSGEDLLELMEANISLGLVLLQALSSVSRAKRSVFINTGTALAPDVSGYALSKTQFAQWGRLHAHDASNAIQFINVELQHMYGPGDDANKFTTRVLHACRRNEPSIPLTLGEQRRDFVFIDDVVSGYDAILLNAPALPSAVDIPLGSGVAGTIREYVQTAHDLCASKTELHFGAIPYRASEAMHCVADLSTMRRLGWSPRWDLRSGLLRTLETEAFG